MNLVDIFDYLKEENESFDAEAFKADPYAFFEKNNWIIPTLNRDKIIIALADYFKNNKKLAGQNVAILIKLADHNKDFGEYLNNYSKLNEECERDKKRKKAIEFNEYSLIASRSSKLKKALAVLCMIWAVKGLAPAVPQAINKIKAPTSISQTVNEEMESPFINPFISKQSLKNIYKAYLENEKDSFGKAINWTMEEIFGANWKERCNK